MSLSIGIVLGGPELARSPVDALLTRLGRGLIDLRAREPRQGRPELNLVFYAPGSKFSPDFSGIRVSTFSRRTKTLMVQIALSEEQVRSPDAEEILRVCKAAVEVGTQWLATRISYESKHALSLLAEVSRKHMH